MIDIGANLTHDSFSHDLDEVIQRARKAGIAKLIVTGSNEENSREALKLSEQYPSYCYSTVGIHPHESAAYNTTFDDTVRELCQYDTVVAIGETGLDYFRNFSPKEKQIDSFVAHLNLARELNKPLFLHERDSFVDFLPIMKEHADIASQAVVHCFTGKLEALEAYIELGCYIGITGWLCDKQRGRTLRKIVKNIPLDRIMIETDAPYLLPHKEKLSKIMKEKRRNEPHTLGYVASELALRLDVEEEVLIEAATENAERFFWREQ